MPHLAHASCVDYLLHLFVGIVFICDAGETKLSDNCAISNG